MRSQMKGNPFLVFAKKARNHGTQRAKGGVGYTHTQCIQSTPLDRRLLVRWHIPLGSHGVTEFLLSVVQQKGVTKPGAQEQVLVLTHTHLENSYQLFTTATL